jgi:hypothetical protein
MCFGEAVMAIPVQCALCAEPFQVPDDQAGKTVACPECGETHLGEIHDVYHELISDLVHIDIHHVAPDDERPFHTLVTSGMSDLPMTVPEGVEALRFRAQRRAAPAVRRQHRAVLLPRFHRWRWGTSVSWRSTPTSASISGGRMAKFGKLATLTPAAQPTPIPLVTCQF